MCLSFLRVCLRSCAHPSQLRSCLSLHSRTISLTTARSLSPLSIYLSLIFSSSFSLLLSAHLHLNMPRFIASASSGRKHRGHSLPSFFFHGRRARRRRTPAVPTGPAPRPRPLAPTALPSDGSPTCSRPRAGPAVGMVAACFFLFMTPGSRCPRPSSRS